MSVLFYILPGVIKNSKGLILVFVEILYLYNNYNLTFLFTWYKTWFHTPLMFFQRAQGCLDEPSSGWKDTVEVNGYLEGKEFTWNSLKVLSLAVHLFMQTMPDQPRSKLLTKQLKVKISRGPFLNYLWIP